MTDLREMSWPDRLRYAVAQGWGVSELAGKLGRSVSAVSLAQGRHGIRLPDKRRSADEGVVQNGPTGNPLSRLSDAERADYDVLKTRGKMTRAEALAAIGRGDLLEGDR